MGDQAMAPEASFLEVETLTKRFGGLVAVDQVSFSVKRGTVQAIIGPNGAGKTSVFNCITSFEKPTSGIIRLDGQRIDGLAPHIVATHRVARTYQNVRLFAHVSALDNILMGRHRMLKASIWEAVLRTPRFRKEEAASVEMARELLDFVGISHRGDMLARTMPYGDQRRLEIARALATEPQLLLLDEPAAGMNPAEALRLVKLIQRIRDERGITVLMIEHHMRVVMAISERITVLDRGRVLAEGTPGEIHGDERVVAAYLGTRAAADHRPPTETREVQET
jgi:branched-chain amino acid transport system ATP-binding protein